MHIWSTWEGAEMGTGLHSKQTFMSQHESSLGWVKRPIQTSQIHKGCGRGWYWNPESAQRSCCSEEKYCYTVWIGFLWLPMKTNIWQGSLLYWRGNSFIRATENRNSCKGGRAGSQALVELLLLLLHSWTYYLKLFWHTILRVASYHIRFSQAD